MTEYIFPHSWPHEAIRLDHMSRMLNPFTLDSIERLGISPGWRCLEIGAGNGSISRALCERVGERGQVVAIDLETQLLETDSPDNMEVRQSDILQADLEQSAYDLVCGRAVLHHIEHWQEAVDKLIAALKPSGRILFQEPDIHPLEAQEPSDWRAFWMAYTDWAEASHIDYRLGRELAPAFAALGLEEISARGETQQFNGGSHAAEFYRLSMLKLQSELIASGHIDEAQFRTFERLVSDPETWRITYCFMAVSARKPG